MRTRTKIKTTVQHKNKNTHKNKLKPYKDQDFLESKLKQIIHSKGGFRILPNSHCRTKKRRAQNISVFRIHLANCQQMNPNQLA